MGVGKVVLYIAAVGAAADGDARLAGLGILSIVVQQERLLLYGGDPAVFAGDIDGNIIALVTRFQIDRGARIGKAVIIKRPCQRCFCSAGNNTVIQIDRSALDGDAGIAR